jgi:hypothetical protein
MPFGGGQPYDLVVHLEENAFLRVQCKMARPVNGCLAFNSRRTDHGYGRRSYAGLADVFGAYFPPRRSVYLVPVRDASGFGVRLRLHRARNNQKSGIRLAADYEIDRWTIDSLREIAGTASQVTEEPAPVA